jgi:resuscitation-promoting factor RpfB
VVSTVIAALVGGGANYLRLEKRVMLVVDGEPRQVRTFGATVGDLLEAADVQVGPHDEVLPAPAAQLAEGMRVEVVSALEVTLVLEGQRRTVWVTDARTVEDVLDHVNVPAGEHVYVRPKPKAPVEDGQVIVYRAAKVVELTVDGRTREIITNAPDVGHLLDSVGVILRGKDRVSPGRRMTLEPGMEVTVVRVREVVEEQAIAFDTEVRYSDELYEDEERVEREGVGGLVRSVFRLRFVDGTEASRTLLHREVVSQPVDRIVVRGTRPRNVQEGVASWYERDGMVAAHQTLPFGTEVRITNLANGKSVTVVINDRGPFVEGRIIDLSDDAFAQLAPLSSGTFHARITW